MGIDFLRRFESGRIGDGRFLTAAGVKHDRFEPFGTHQRAQPAARVDARRHAVLVQVQDARRQHLVFAAWADQGDGNLVSKAFAQQPGAGIHALPGQFARRFKARPVFAHVQQPHARRFRLILYNDSLDPQRGDRQPGGAAGVAFLHAAGQRALSAGRDSVAARKHVPHQQTRREDELVVPSQGVAGRRDLIQQDARHQPAPAQPLPGFWNRLPLKRLRANVDSPDFHAFLREN